MIRFACPHCGNQFSGADNLAGQKASCRKCGQLFTVGDPPPILAELVAVPLPTAAPRARASAASSGRTRPPAAARSFEDQHALTLDNSARASNPGNLRVDRFRWLRHYPKWPLIWFSAFAFFSLVACSVHGSYWILAVLLLGANWFYWRRLPVNGSARRLNRQSWAILQWTFYSSKWQTSLCSNTRTSRSARCRRMGSTAPPHPNRPAASPALGAA